MTTRDMPRRSVLAAFSGLAGGFIVAGRAAAATLTPRASEGPFYPTPSMRMADIDNDLVKIGDLVEKAGGEVFTLSGTITDSDGRPLVGHRIEIWQCDMNGKYMHPRDSRRVSYDQAFQGFGHDITDESGRYMFRTIKPTVYPGRTPHIHVKVLDGDRDLLTTQFYIKDHPNNARDWLFNRMSSVESDSVSMVFVGGTAGPEATINIRL